MPVEGMLISSKKNKSRLKKLYINILFFTFLFSLFVFVSVAGFFCLRYTITKTCRLIDLHVLSMI
jgi:hypothetical protein